MKLTIPIKLIPIDNDGFHLSVNITINGKKANAIIDTGASRTVFDKERIKKYVKKRSKKIKDKLSSGLGTNNMESHLISIEKLTIGKLTVKNYSTVLLDLSHVNTSYNQIGIKEIDGVIGSDILHRFKATIDYNKLKLILSK